MQLRNSWRAWTQPGRRSEEHTSELQSLTNLVCRLLLTATHPTLHTFPTRRSSDLTFYVPDASTPQELNDLTNVLRSLFDIRFVMQQPQNNTIMVRAPQRTLDAATQFMESLDSARPQIGRAHV